MLHVTVNGECHKLAAPLSIKALLGHFGLDGRKIAVEHNLEIVPRSIYDKVVVKDGDRLEIVHFVGGG